VPANPQNNPQSNFALRNRGAVVSAVKLIALVAFAIFMGWWAVQDDDETTWHPPQIQH